MASKGAVVIDVIAQIDEAQKQLQEIKTNAESLDPTINLEVDFSTAEQGLENIKQKVQELNTDISSKGIGMGGFFDNLITKIGGKITGLGSDFSLVFGLAKQHLTDIGMKLGSIIGIIGIVLAVVYVLIDAFKEVVGENEELNQELQWIGAVLNNLIMPLIDTIKSVVLTFLKGVIKVIKAILGWVRDIIKAVSGKDIFAGIEINENVGDNALASGIGKAVGGAVDLKRETAKTRENTKGINKDTSGISKNLKEARKQLAGFDEMNVLSDNTSSGSGLGGGIGGGGVNLNNLYEAKDLVQDILPPAKKIGEDVINIVNSIAEKSHNVYGDWKKDIILTTKSHKELTDEQYIQIRTMENQIVHLKSKNKLTDKEKKILKDVTGAYGDLYREGRLSINQQQIYKTLTDQTIKTDQERIVIIQELQKKENAEYYAKKNGISVQEAYNKFMYNGKYYIDRYGNSLDDVAKKYGLNKDQINKLKGAIDTYNNSTEPAGVKTQQLKEAIEKLGSEAGLSYGDILTLNKEIQGMKSKEVEITVKRPLAQTLVDMGREIATKIGTKKIIDLKVQAPSQAEINKIAKEIANKLASASKGVGFTVASLVSSIKGNRKGALIKYASGGIINQPGRGVPLAVGGEAGREGVVPLTDSQQMALLGEAIGKYITINANITNSMNGRIISRELQKIQNEQSFASNRW